MCMCVCLSVTPCPLCWWIIYGGSTVRITDKAMVDKWIIPPFNLHMNVKGIFPRQLLSTTMARPVHHSCAYALSYHVIFFLPALQFSCSSITRHPQNNKQRYKLVCDRCFVQLWWRSDIWPAAVRGLASQAHRQLICYTILIARWLSLTAMQHTLLPAVIQSEIHSC